MIVSAAHAAVTAVALQALLCDVDVRDTAVSCHISVHLQKEQYTYMLLHAWLILVVKVRRDCERERDEILTDPVILSTRLLFCCSRKRTLNEQL